MDLEPTGLWGIEPSQGTWLDGNATFEGLSGGLASGGRHDVSYGPAWVWTHERGRHFDFTPSVGVSRMLLAYNFREPAIAFDLLLRPFALSTWALIACCLLTTVIMAKIQRSLLIRREDDEFDSLRTSATAGWIFFTLISAYYGGALTMFFTTTTSLPFDTLEEGSELFPAWKYLHRRQFNVAIQTYLRRNGRVGLPDLLRRISDGHYERWIVDDIPQGLERMSREPQTFMYAGEYELTSALNRESRPWYAGLHLKFAGDPTRLTRNFMLAKNSPYRRLFSEGGQALVQSGLLEAVLLRWRGRMPRASQDGMKILGLEHVGLAFLAHLAGLLCCLVVLGFECFKRKPILGVVGGISNEKQDSTTTSTDGRTTSVATQTCEERAQD